MATRRQPDRRFPNRRPRGPHPSPAPTPTRVLAVRSADAPTRTAAMRRGATADARRAAINRATAASGDPSWHCKQSSFLSSASGELVERGASRRRRRRRMGRGRGVSYGGGQSSLSYLFGGGGGDEPAAAPAKPAAAVEQRAQQPAATPAPAPAAADAEKQKGIPAGVRGSQTNNYFRAQGQNCGNFLTDRPSTKVHAAPGGGSSLGYLFGGGPPGSK